MTDYRVVYLDAEADDDRAAISARVEKECDHAAREGWYLHDVVPDLLHGTTRGLWLVFGTGDDVPADAPAIATAEEILSEAAEQA
jgi:hypothetical protein